jgi:PAS domain S-box-containing protein
METLNDVEANDRDPVIIVDSDGLVTRVNESFTREYSWTEEALVGQPLSKIIPSEMRDMHHAGFSRFVNSGSPRILGKALDLPILKGDGETLNAKHFIVAEKRDGKWVIGAVITRS